MTAFPSADGMGFHGTGHWAVILGGSSGFGLATAKRLAKAGLHILLAHKDRADKVETELKEHFDFIREQDVHLVTHNGNLSDEEERCAMLALISERAGPGKVHIFMHSVASGSLKLLAEDPQGRHKQAALKGLAAALSEEGTPISPETLQRAVNRAFHHKACDALYTLADSNIPYPEGLLEEEDLAQTLRMMGYDYYLWGKELLTRGLLAKNARLISMTSEGSSVAWKGYAAVSAAKRTLEALCRSMALEMAPYGVRTFLIQAGITDTPAANAIANFDLMKAQARLRNPLGRLTRPEDVADAIYALCLPLFDWANGTVIRLDGGEAISGGSLC